jgi:hypothetical protein
VRRLAARCRHVMGILIFKRDPPFKALPGGDHTQHIPKGVPATDMGRHATALE